MKLLLYCPVAHSERFFFKMLLRYNERELVASQQVLEELFNEEERIAIYRAHYELEKAKAEARENGAASVAGTSGRNEEGRLPNIMYTDLQYKTSKLLTISYCAAGPSSPSESG